MAGEKRLEPVRPWSDGPLARWKCECETHRCTRIFWASPKISNPPCPSCGCFRYHEVT